MTSWPTRLAALIAITLPFDVSAGTALAYDTHLQGRTKVERSRIDSRHIVQIRGLLVFVGTMEFAFSSTPAARRWYDVVTFNCRTKDFSVLFAAELEEDPKTVEELLVDTSTAEEDAQTYGHLHDWQAVHGLSALLSKRCGKVVRSGYSYLPYRFAESSAAVWWLDLATMEDAGQTKKVFALAKKYTLEPPSRSGVEVGRVTFDRQDATIFQWSLDCSRKTVATLSRTRFQRDGSIADEDHTVEPPKPALLSTVARKALDLTCQLSR